MHGGPKVLYKNKQHEKAMQAPIEGKEEDIDIMDLQKRFREAGGM